VLCDPDEGDEVGFPPSHGPRRKQDRRRHRGRRGQGAAEALALAHEGATVIATDLHEEDPRLGEGIVYRRLDVSRPED
jgi:hypothetical protein